MKFFFFFFLIKLIYQNLQQLGLLAGDPDGVDGHDDRGGKTPGGEDGARGGAIFIFILFLFFIFSIFNECFSFIY
jgi:hypothetical protein